MFTVGLFILVAAATSLVLAGCVRTSGGTWYFDSAPLPEGWPELTPVGWVEIREYPSYRAAVVSEMCLHINNHQVGSPRCRDGIVRIRIMIRIVP